MSAEGERARAALVETLFHGAWECARDEREAFLRARAGGDEGVVREVLGLLALAEDSDDGFLETPVTLGADERVERGEFAAQELGSYRVVRLLGEGGMGVVYLAEQRSPRRTVALKVIRATLVSAQARRRFQQEAEALGRLHHPGIGQIFEARLEGSNPYFAMEYVDGLTLGAHADAQGLSMRARLGLLAEIADAIQHAHERGVVHRDLKPGNILVTGEGRAKVLDFGVSRLVGDGGATLRTEAGQLLGTVAYMSPEQASGDPSKVDARTDVYALGVIAFELLTGHPPFALSGRSIPEAVRIVSEEEPTAPSVFERSLRGDVETILRRAMERDRALRYQSAGEFAADVRRYLADEPIHARPPSAAYHLRKFARRHRALVAGALAVFVVLGLGMAGTSVGLARSIVSERRARQAARIAEREAATAKAINDFLVQDLLSSPAPYRKGRDVRVADVLDEAAAKASALSERPVVLAEVRATLGEAYLGLEMYDKARAQLEGARAIRQRELGADDARTLKAEAGLGRVDVMEGRLQEGLEALERVAAAQTAHFGEDDPDALSTRADIGATLERLGRSEEALEVGRAVALKRIETQGELSRDSLTSMRNVALTAISMGNLDEGEEWLGRAERALLASGRADDPELVYVLDGEASVHLSRGEPELAVPVLERSLEIARSAFGEDTATVGVVLVNLGNAYVGMGERARARALYEQAAGILRERLGEDHDWTMMAVDNLAEATARLGDPDLAESMLNENIARRRRVLGEDHPSIAYSLSSLAMAMASRQEWGRAAAQFDRAAEVHLTASGARSDPYLSARSNEAFCLFRAGDFEGAERVQEVVLAAERGQSSRGGRQYWSDLRMLARINLEQGDAPGAQKVVEEMRAIVQENGEDNGRAATIAGFEGRARVLAGEMEEGIESLKGAAEAMLAPDGPDADLDDTVRALAGALRARGDEEAATEWERRVAKSRENPTD